MGDMFVNREALDRVLQQMRINSSKFITFAASGGDAVTGGTSAVGHPVLVPRDAVELQLTVTRQSAGAVSVFLSDGQGTSPKVLLEVGGSTPANVVGHVFRLDVREFSGKTLKLNADAACCVLVNYMGRGSN